MATAKEKSPELKDIFKNKSFWLFPVIVLVVIGSSFMLVLLPQLQALIDSRAILVKDSERLERLEEKRSRLEGIADSELKGQYELATKALPNEKPVVSVLAALNGMSEVAGVSLQGYDFTPGSLATESAQQEAAKVGVGVMPVSFSISGEYDGIVHFMRLVELTSPLMQFENAVINGLAAPIGSITTDLTAELMLKVYFSPVPETLGKPSDPLEEFSAADLSRLELLKNYTVYSSDVSADTLLDQEPNENLFAF